MAVISEISDDGSNGGVPTKNPQEEQKQNEKPKEEDQEDDQEENFAPIPPHIPEELIEIILAMVRRCNYPRLSLVSKGFGHVISSETLFATRSRLGLTEPVLYTLISFPRSDTNPCWFILHRSNISLRLSRVMTSLPPMFHGSTAVTIGHKMYVMGGCTGINHQPVKTVIVIDCRFHKWKYLESMQRERCKAAAGVIDGKIYVVGGREKRYDDWVEVLDVEKGVWETVPGPFPSVARSSGLFVAHVVLDNKIYILHDHCLAYDPRRCTWENWAYGSNQTLFWHASSCVVDDCLYAIVPETVPGSRIQVYNPRDMVWRPVKGIGSLPNLFYYRSRMANFGGKLVVLGLYHSSDYYSQKNVWCFEVALEKREDGDIWGKVEPVVLVHSFGNVPALELSRTVTV